MAHIELKMHCPSRRDEIIIFSIQQSFLNQVLGLSKYSLHSAKPLSPTFLAVYAFFLPFHEFLSIFRTVEFEIRHRCMQNTFVVSESSSDDAAAILVLCHYHSTHFGR
jgi:hypothetical protein